MMAVDENWPIEAQFVHLLIHAGFVIGLGYMVYTVFQILFGAK
jgi:Tfp pilus assembly protein PilO